MRANLEESVDQRAEIRSWWPFFILLAFVISVFMAIAAVIWLTARWIFS